MITTANSWNSRPIIPLINSTGINTAASEIVIEIMVNPISLAPSIAAVNRSFPISMWRTMFSSMTIASSTTKATESVSAIKDRLSSVYPSRDMAAKVPMSDMGNARLGIMVAEILRRKRKITNTTSTTVKSSVNFTSFTDSRIDCDRSSRIHILTDGGRSSRNVGSRFLTESTTSTVLVPGCF